MKKNYSLLPKLLVGLCVHGTGCSNTPPAKPPTPAAPTAAESSTPSSAASADQFGTATIHGRITFEGKRPTPKPLNMAGDASCATSGKVVLEEGKTITADGGVPYTFVYIKKGINGKYPPPESPVLLTQKGCMYEPHIFGIQVGQPLKIVNADPTAHNVHAMPKKNTPFNVSQPAQNMVSTQSFTRPEIGLKIKCDVHGWMSSYAGVVAHPFFAVTDAAGNFKIDRLPPGEYEVEAWHELFQTVSKTVTVKDGESADLNLVYSKGANP